MPTEQQIAAEALTIANGALPATVRAYEPSKVPSPRPAEFVVVTLVERAGGNTRGGRTGRTGWALYVMAASQSYEANARNSLQKVDAALRGRVLSVDGSGSTPVRFDNARPVAPDDGWFSGVKTYHFAL